MRKKLPIQSCQRYAKIRKIYYAADEGIEKVVIIVAVVVVFVVVVVIVVVIIIIIFVC